MGGQLRCNMLNNLHFSWPPIFATSSDYFVFFSFFGLNFVQLFGGISELYFLQTLYAQKYLDVQFPMVLALLDLELRSLRYGVQKKGDAILKNYVTFFFKNFVSCNLGYIPSIPFYEKQPRPCSSSWISWIIPVFAQSVQFIVRSWSKNCLFFLLFF